jgi:hypothetical protein
MGQSSGSSDDPEAVAMSGAITGSQQIAYSGQDPYRLDGVSAGTFTGGTMDGTGSYFDPTPSPEETRTQPLESQQEPFLGNEPTDVNAEVPSAGDRGSYYGDWMAPAAGVAGAGATVAATEAYIRHEQEREALGLEKDDPEVPAKSESKESQIFVENAVAVESNRATTGKESVASADEAVAASKPHTITTVEAANQPNATTIAADSAALGGNEAEGARETGAIFPRVIRHNTDMSVSQLHIPGEYPKRE